MSEISVEFLAALSRLTLDEREIVVDRVVRGASLSAVAERFGVSSESIRTRERKALDKLKVALDEVGFVRL